MRTFIQFSAAIALSFFILAAPRVLADPVAEVASFSIFKKVELPKLAKGEVMTAHGVAMGFARGLEVESLYVLPFPVQKANDLQQRWNGAKHSELKVYQHLDLPRKPGAQD